MNSQPILTDDGYYIQTIATALYDDALARAYKLIWVQLFQNSNEMDMEVHLETIADILEGETNAKISKPDC